MGCTKSTPVVDASAPAEAFDPTPHSVANCSVEGIFYCESSPVLRPSFAPSRPQRLSIERLDTTVLNIDVTTTNEKLAKLVSRINTARSDQTLLHLFYAWRLLTLRSKDALTANLVHLAKQLPELTRVALPQGPGM